MVSTIADTTTKPSSNTNPTPTSPSLSPYDVRCVTQTQDSERLFNSPESSQESITTEPYTLEDRSQMKSDLFNGLLIRFRDTALDSFNLNAHPWQCEIGAKIMEARIMKRPLKHLCVRPTGGGKSLVFNVVASLLRDVTICICPLLSLGADQTEKTLNTNIATASAPLTSFHLDEMKTKDVFKLKSKLRDQRSEPTGTIIYMSPQSLATRKGNDLIQFLIRKELIQFVVMDEIHLASSFGNTFRKEFGQLPDFLFSQLKDYCPMLFLTATCTSDIKRDFELLMKLQINSWNWPSSNEMKHRCVSIDTRYTTKPFQYVMRTFKSMITDSDDGLPNKVIVYSNTRERILNFAESIRKRMNSDPVMTSMIDLTDSTLCFKL